MTLADRIVAQPAPTRRALALLLAATMAAASIAAVHAIFSIVSSQESWRSTARKALAQDRGIAANDSQVRGALDSLSSAPTLKRFYAPSADTDGAQLVQRDVVSLGTLVGAGIQSTAALPTVEDVQLRVHGVRLVASMSIDQLKDFIARIRAHANYLRVQELNISAPQVQTPDVNPPLTVTVTILGYSRPQPRASGDAA
jgi:hypothetical protein